MSALAGYDLFKKELLPAPHLTLTKYVFSGSFVKSIVSSGLAPIGEGTLFNGRQLFMLLIWPGCQIRTEARKTVTCIYLSGLLSK